MLLQQGKKGMQELNEVHSMMPIAGRYVQAAREIQAKKLYKANARDAIIV